MGLIDINEIIIPIHVITKEKKWKSSTKIATWKLVLEPSVFAKN